MSNTVMFIAATGETAWGKSLSSADEVHVRLRRRVERHRYWQVPILWVDLEYPLVMVASYGTRPENPIPLRGESSARYGPSFGWRTEMEAAERILAWGGNVFEQPYRYPPELRACEVSGYRLSYDPLQERRDEILADAHIRAEAHLQRMVRRG